MVHTLGRPFLLLLPPGCPACSTRTQLPVPVPPGVGRSACVEELEGRYQAPLQPRAPGEVPRSSWGRAGTAEPAALPVGITVAPLASLATASPAGTGCELAELLADPGVGIRLGAGAQQTAVPCAGQPGSSLVPFWKAVNLGRCCTVKNASTVLKLFLKFILTKKCTPF